MDLAVPTVPGPEDFVLQKKAGIRVVVGVTSLLSIAGSLLIIFSYLLFKDIRTRARLILFHLSVTDLGVALANFIGDVVNFDRFYITNGSLTDPTHVADSFCKAQAFFALFFTISSIFWTCILAVYMYFLVIEKGVPFLRWYLRFSYGLCYGMPLMIAAWLLATERLGYSPYNSSGWCSVKLKEVPYMMKSSDTKRHANTDSYVAVFGYDLWIYTTIVLTAIVYLSTHLYIRKEQALRKVSQKTGQSSAIFNVEFKFILIPVLFILLRIWSLINNVIFVYAGYNDKYFPQSVTELLQYLTGIGDTGQGAINGLIFVLFTKEVRKKLFHRCCLYCKHGAVQSYSSGNSVHVNVARYEQSSVTDIGSTDKKFPGYDPSKEEIEPLYKDKESLKAEVNSLYTPLSSYESNC